MLLQFNNLGCHLQFASIVRIVRSRNEVGKRTAGLTHDLPYLHQTMRPRHQKIYCNTNRPSRNVAMSKTGPVLVAVLLALASIGAVTDSAREEGLTATEIRIGNVMPYSGNMELF